MNQHGTDAPGTPAVGALPLLAPLSGTTVALADVPDDVFAQEIVGPGVAVEPRTDPDGAGLRVVSPADGVVGSLYAHALAVERADGRTVLLHLGIDTMSLRGEGFTLHVAEGDTITAGQHLVTWDPRPAVAAGLSTVCLVVALQAEPGSVERLHAPGLEVRLGETVAVWR